MRYILGALVILPVSVVGAAAAVTAGHFGDLAAGSAPTGWSATQRGTGHATWAVVADETATSKPNGLTQSGQATYPIWLKDDTSGKDGLVAVKFKALSGKE